MLFGSGAKVVKIDASVFHAGDHNDPHAGHDGARRIRAVGRGWNQHDVAIGLPAVTVVGTNDEQTGELTLGARIGLEGNRRESGNLAKRRLELADDRVIAVSLFHRGERVKRGKL